MISKENLDLYNIYINIENLHQLITHSDKFHLYEMIHYYKNNSIDDQHPDIKKTLYSMGYLNDLCSFF